MKHLLIVVSALVFAMFGVNPWAQAQDFVDANQLCGTTVNTDTEVKGSGDFKIDGDCRIKVKDATLEIVGVKIAVDGGDLRFDDTSDNASEEASRLIIRSSQVTTTGKVRIEGPWDGGVDFRGNQVNAGDDVRVKPVGLGDLYFRNNHGDVAGDIRLGDTGLQGDTDARNNNIAVAGDFRAASTDGDIGVRNNTISNVVNKVQIVSDGSGDISVKENSFNNTEGEQDVEMTSQTGDVSVLHNRFGQSVNSVTIKSYDGGQCESTHNRPEVVDISACLP
jgi:hypothetical protein